MSDRLTTAQMTRRDWFAAHAPEPPEGIIEHLAGHSPRVDGSIYDSLEWWAWRMKAKARWSYLYADAMIKAGAEHVIHG